MSCFFETKCVFVESDKEFAYVLYDAATCKSLPIFCLIATGISFFYMFSSLFQILLPTPAV